MWFRVYTDVRDDPKVQRLPGETFKQWINLLCLAKEHGGLLPPVEDIAFKLRMTDADAKCLVEELVKRKLLDITDEGMTPHNWDNRQFLSDDDPTAAVRARRYRQRNVTRDATSDVTDASRPASRTPETETETEQKQNQSRGGLGEPDPAASRGKPRSASRRVQTCDEEFLEELQANPAYAELDVRRLYHKMAEWCRLKGKQPTRGRLLNWLNREDRPMAPQSPQKKPDPGANKSAPYTLEEAARLEETFDWDDWVTQCIANGWRGQLEADRKLIAERGGPKEPWEYRVYEYLNAATEVL